MIGKWLKASRDKKVAAIRAQVFEQIGTAFYGIGQYYFQGPRSADATASAVWACVNLISSRIGAARWKVIQRKKNGNYEHKRNHPLNLLLAYPNPRISAFPFWRTVAEQVLISGNAYLLPYGRMEGYHTRMNLTVPESVSIRNKFHTYEYCGTEPRPGGQGLPFTRGVNDIIHAQGPHYDPQSGLSVSPIQHAAKLSIDLLRTAQISSQQFMKNQTKFSGVFQTEIGNVDSAETQNYFQRMKDEMSGHENKGFSPFLPFGVKYVWPPSMQRDMQTAGDMDWAVADIARVYGIPVEMIASEGPRPAVEETEDALMRNAVLPIVKAISAGLSRTILNKEDRMKELFIDADLRQYSGPTTGRARKGLTESQSGVITINEIREGMGYGPRPDGDLYPTAAGAPTRDPEWKEKVDSVELDEEAMEENEKDNGEEGESGEDDMGGEEGDGDEKKPPSKGKKKADPKRKKR